MPNQIPIIGEPMSEWLKDAIDKRQEVYGSGVGTLRTPEELTYLNSRTSWIKMASSVDIKNSERTIQLEGLMGTDLAKKGVLFNGLSSDGKPKSGVAAKNSKINDSAYGFGGTEFGIQPMPGIIDFSVKHEVRGSIRTGTINIKAYNKFQFDLIELLYLRLGFTVMIEWGNSHYYDKDGKFTTMGATYIDEKNGWFTDADVTQLQMLTNITNNRKAYNGNYDAFFGRIVNFSWSFQTDGSYDISIQLSSLGDVVESFNINKLPLRLTSPDKGEDETKSGTKNQNSIVELFRKLREEKIPSSPKTSSTSTKKVELFNTYNKHFVSTTFNGNQQVVQKYVRFDVFLQLLLDYIVFTVEPCTPFFNLDVTSLLRIKAIKNIMPLDPQICIFSTDFRDVSRKGSNNVPNVQNILKVGDNTQRLTPFFTGDTFESGLLNNVYLNFDFIENTSKNNVDSKGNISFYKYIEGICNGINRNLGNICNIEPILYEENNTLSFIDTNLEVKLDPKTGKQELPDDTNNGKLLLFGYDGKKSNFVKNYSFQTLINNELKTAITIGATANTDVVNENQTAFSKWNDGLEDRFNKKIFTRKEDVSGDCDVTKITIQVTEEAILKAKTEDIKFDTLYKQPNPNLSDNNNFVTQQLKEKTIKNASLRTQDIPIFSSEEVIASIKFAPEIAKTATSLYKDYIRKSFKIKTSMYTQFNKDHIAQGKSLLEGYINAQNQVRFTNPKTGKRKNPSSNIGFIPIELEVEIDGLSGIRIYNELKIDQKFLPQNYPDVLEFVIKGVDHKLANNNWTTAIRAIGKPKTILTDEIVEETTEGANYFDYLGDFSNPEEIDILVYPIKGTKRKIVVTSPYGERVDPIEAHNRTQQEALAKQDHKGIDLRADKGTLIYSSLSNGKVVKTGEDAKSGRYVVIRGIGIGSKSKKKREFRIAYLHMDAIKVKEGDSIKIGKQLGTVGNSGSSTAPHVHIKFQEIIDGKRYFRDPVKFFKLEDAFELPTTLYLKGNDGNESIYKSKNS